MDPGAGHTLAVARRAGTSRIQILHAVHDPVEGIVRMSKQNQPGRRLGDLLLPSEAGLVHLVHETPDAQGEAPHRGNRDDGRADGLLVEVHPNPEDAFSDGEQSLLPEKFEALMKEAAKVAEAVGRTI